MWLATWAHPNLMDFTGLHSSSLLGPPLVGPLSIPDMDVVIAHCCDRDL